MHAPESGESKLWGLTTKELRIRPRVKGGMGSSRRDVGSMNVFLDGICLLGLFFIPETCSCIISLTIHFLWISVSEMDNYYFSKRPNGCEKNIKCPSIFIFKEVKYFES